MAIRRCTLRSALPVLVLASALALSACSGGADAESQRPPTGSASASATATPTPAADSRPTPASSTGAARNLPRPQLPAAAKENTKAGFEAFTQYWFDTATYALESGDKEALAAISAADCKVCAGYLKDIAAGGWSVGPKWTTDAFVTDMKLDPLGQAVGYFMLDEGPSKWYDRSGTVTKDRKGGNNGQAKAIYATYSRGAWKARQLGQA
jgi:hypothetical protein